MKILPIYLTLMLITLIIGMIGIELSSGYTFYLTPQLTFEIIK